MKVHKSITVERAIRAAEADDYLGFCILCGQEAVGVEPDAQERPCDFCDAPGVYGAEELVLLLA